MPKTCSAALNVAAALTVSTLLLLVPSTVLAVAVSKPFTVAAALKAAVA